MQPLPVHVALCWAAHDVPCPSFLRHSMQWMVYWAWKGDLPSAEELEQLDGLVLPGSHEDITGL